MKKISIMIPCYNEVGNVRAMAESLTDILQGLSYDYEIIFTDNCSTDGTKDVLKKLAQEDGHIRVLINNRNYGVDGRSSKNAMRYVNGDVVVHIPCDFQEPPELLPEFISCWEEGYQVVCGQKTGSKEGWIKYGCRSIFYKIIQMLSDTPQYEHVSGIILYDREVMKECEKADYDLDLRFVLADMGYKIKFIQYEQKERRSGRSSYNIWRYLTFAINSMISTSVAPLRIMTVLGVMMSALSFMIGIIYLVLKMAYWHNFSMGTAPILIGMFFLGSVQLLFMGVLGEYVGVILRKVTKKPDVILSEKINVEDVEK